MPTLEPVDLIFTSPPYNLGGRPGRTFGHYENGSRGGQDSWQRMARDGGIRYDTHDDDMPWPEYEAWQRAVLSACWAQLTDTGAVFYNHKPRVTRDGLWTPLTLIQPEAVLRQIVYWDRCGGPNFTPTNYRPQTEWLMVLARDAWRLDYTGVGDVWRVPPDRDTEHPAPFPLELPRRAITTAMPASVLDPFCGSGTTLRAAKDAGVQAIGIDKSEAYCQMAAERCGAHPADSPGAFEFEFHR
jgi:site-specific DNA-methyltransferase (adenine-specific)